MREQAFEPIKIPDEVWEREQTREVLKRRDIPGLFELARKYAGASQARIGAATGISQGRISRYMRGLIQVTELEVYERIATGLGLPDHARTLFGVGATHTDAFDGADDHEQRQQHEELTARLDAAASIDSTMVAILNVDTNNLRLMDRKLGAVAIADKMRAQSNQVARALHHAVRPGIRAKLAHILAETASLAGWQAIDMCGLSDAWQHYERAKSAAREADDPAVLAYVSGEQAYVLADLGRPAEATELLQYVHATYRSRIPALTRTWLSAAEAELAAILGDEKTCRTALDQAATLLGDNGHDPAMPYISLNTAHLARWRGSCLLHFGDPDTAEDLRSALAGMDGTYNRAEAGTRCDLAHALLAAGEPEAALPHIHRAQQLATMTGSRRQRRRIEEVARLTKRALS
ncbi:transcriptional regulator with XRE-family HTH domain [Thermocatellispora tengchongensis]|uniref:Transcriptional regulator with XRE-family HTH domain n=1 Tax=Thermocatellispora tengchongensis TaxID=1073253 RepID=A0A840PLN6_9ACTN|nr:helix-turn-helix transcriptional regulator [Thermocatellispora tengchongensis]MBB5139859.1 transcriptional regulator with XRE-family HTH domain [Thermocatellispora tengchongensis]